MIPQTLLVAALTVSLSLSPTPAASPPDARIDEALRAFEQAWEKKPRTIEAIRKAAAEATQGLALDDLTPLQIGRLLTFQHLLGPLGGQDAAWDRLETFLDDRGPDGATAAIHTLARRLHAAADDDARLQILKAAITHPGLDAAIAAGSIPDFFDHLSVARRLAPKAADEIMALDRFLTPELAPRLATSLTSFYELARAAHPDDKERIETLRAGLVEAARNALPSLSERDAAFVKGSVVDYLDGAFARGTLINGPAPAVEIIWSSDPAIATLEALKGRVVILDFWATWCGPCVASIAKVRELAARYEGYPVTIIGVTSIQGSHYPGGGEPPVETEGDPDKEFALMADYIEQRDITWPIVFTKESCFNNAYGVRGIPHVTIIDPAGNVRHNNLHPGAPLADKAALIDALLKEANLPTPDPLTP